MKLSKALYLLGGLVFLAALVLFLVAISTSFGLYAEAPPCGVQCTELDVATWLIPPGLALVGAGAAWELAIGSSRKDGTKGRQFNLKAGAILAIVLVVSTSAYAFTTLWRPAGSCLPVFLDVIPWSSNVHVDTVDGSIIAGTGYLHNYTNPGGICFYDRFGILRSQFLTDRIIQSLAVTSDGSYVAAGGYQLLGFAQVYANGMVYLFNGNGEKIWNLSTGTLPVFNVQMNHNGSLIVVNDEGLLVTSLSGRILWNYSQLGIPGTAIVGDGTGVVVAANGYIALLNNKGSVVWNHTIGFVQSPAIAATDSNIAVGTCESGFSGTVYYLDLSGNVVWSKYTSGCLTGIKFSDGNSRILVEGNSGNLVFDTQGNLVSNRTS